MGLLNMKIVSIPFQIMGVLFRLLREWPTICINFVLGLIRSFFCILTYHLFSLPPKPLHNEIALILGSDTPMGRAFATQIVQKNGTVVMLDKNQEQGDKFAKTLNDTSRDMRAFFYECDVRSKDELLKVIDDVNKNLGDVSILLNCSTESTVATYYDAFKALLPIMKSNEKGVLVFLRTSEAETRNAVAAIYESITKELKVANIDTVSTLLANIFPKIANEVDHRSVFGSVKPEMVASMVIDGIVRNREVIYAPEYMLFLTFWLKFLPLGLVQLIDGFLFNDKRKYVTI